MARFYAVYSNAELISLLKGYLISTVNYPLSSATEKSYSRKIARELRRRGVGYGRRKGIGGNNE